MIDDSKLAQRKLDLENEPVSSFVVSEVRRLMTTPDLTAQRMKALRLIEAGFGDSWLVLEATRYEAGLPAVQRHCLVLTADYEPMSGTGLTKERATKLADTHFPLKPNDVAYVLTPVALIAKVGD